MSKDEWHLSIRGEKRGPFSEEKISEILSNKTHSAVKILLWKNGMNEWLAPEKIHEFKQITSPHAPTIRKPVMIDPVKIAHQPNTDSSNIPDCDGLSRLAFNLISYIGSYIILALSAVLIYRFITFAPIGTFAIDSSFVLWSPFYPILCYIAVHIVSGIKRTKNAGYPAWLYFTILVPVLNLWTLFILHCGGNNFRVRKQFKAIEALCLCAILCFIGTEFWLTKTQKVTSARFVLDRAVAYSFKSQPTAKEQADQVLKWAQGLSKKEKAETLKQFHRAAEKRAKQKEIYDNLHLQRLLNFWS